MDNKIAAVMSVPMCGWNPHWGMTSEALRQHNIPIQLAWGAWWDHGMSNLFDDLLRDGVEWALTMDYDSMFTARHVGALLERFGENPHIDSLAALQAKRVMPVEGVSYETPLVRFLGGKEGEESNGEAIEVERTHFGLTLFRLEKLRNVPRPWFLHVPDSNGGYTGEDRIDPDIYFWQKWREAGNNVYLDPYVTIGHLQPMVLCFDESCNVVYKHWVRWKQDERKAQVAA